MKYRFFFLVSLVLLSYGSICMGQDLDTVIGSINWTKGPARVSIGSAAEMDLPSWYMYADGNDTRKLLEAMQNLTSGQELALISNKDLSTFAVYYFDETGYVKDDEKGSLDADAMISQIQKSTAAGNEEKKKRGWRTMSVAGWDIKPRYNTVTNNLEWAIRFNDEAGDGSSTNYNTRYLGRRGVMRAILVSDPKNIQASIEQFQGLMTGFTFTGGNKYSEYVKGDKVAKYGLSALVVGAAAAAAVKGGLFKYLGKFIFAIGLAVIAFFKSIFDKIKNGFSGRAKEQ